MRDGAAADAFLNELTPMADRAAHLLQPYAADESRRD
jgi:hypothetical protein